MNDFDLDRLGEVWRTQPDEAEMAALQRSAEQVRRRARLGQLTDFGLAALVSTVVLILMLSNPKVETGILGAAAIALMLYGSIRQRQFRMLELKSLSGTAEEMLDQSIARVEATLKRTRQSLIITLPGFPIGVGFGVALNSGSGSDLLNRFSENPWLGRNGIVAALLVAAAALMIIHLIRTQRRSRRELEQLAALREAYREESEATHDG